MEQEGGEEEETKIDQETVFVPEVSDLSQTTTTFSMPTNSERGPSCQAETVDVWSASEWTRRGMICTIAASYEVNQAQKALLLMPRTARVASTSSGELNAQVSLPTDDEYHAPHNQDQLQEH